MLIDRAERAQTWSHGKPLGVAALPGSERVFEPIRKEWKTATPPNTPSYLPRGGGWLIGVSSRLSGRSARGRARFRQVPGESRQSNRIRAERAFPILPVRTSQMASGLPDPTMRPDVDSRLWSVAVEKTLLAERVVTGTAHPWGRRVPERACREACGRARRRAPEKALEAVAGKWAQLTATLGPKRQLWHYRRSLIKLVTPPDPPEPGQ